MGSHRTTPDGRGEQIVTMANADQLSLLHLIVTAPFGQPSATELAGPRGDARLTLTHLGEMEHVGIVSRLAGEPLEAPFRPTADGLARFGGAAIGLPELAPDHVLTPPEHVRVLESISDDLAERFGASFERATVSRFVQDSYRLLASRASVTNYLPVLAARFAAERLGALSQPQTGVVADSVLFVCVRNQGRSQIAAALARARIGDGLVVRTAGSVPASGLDATVVAELDRRGVGGLMDFPRPLTEEVVKASGIIVAMGCGDACPVIPGRHVWTGRFRTRSDAPLRRWRGLSTKWMSASRPCSVRRAHNLPNPAGSRVNEPYGALRGALRRSAFGVAASSLR